MLESIKCKFLNYFEYYSRIKTLEVLRTLSNHQLKDAGLSKDLISQGIKAYPWREGEAAIPLPNHTPKVRTVGLSKRQLKRAEAELRGLSDRDLYDLGLHRSSLGFAVRYGK